MTLPAGALPFFPNSRLTELVSAVQNQLLEFSARNRQHADISPTLEFATHPSWPKARWSATTFQWHPQSKAPPIMGLVFDDADAATEIFQSAAARMNHADPQEQIRVSIIEGDMPEEQNRPGYTVHIGPEPALLAAHIKAADPLTLSLAASLLGQWNRHFPVPGAPPLLPRFKAEFQKHQEYLLAPVLRRPDGQLFARPELGIIKKRIHFRSLSEITPDDPDAAALILPQLIRPPA